MGSEAIVQAIQRIRSLASQQETLSAQSSAEQYFYRVDPPIDWARGDVEGTFQVTLPPDLELLWDQTGGIKLFARGSINADDGAYILSPRELEAWNRNARQYYPRDLRDDDLVVGVHDASPDFYIVARCDLTADDFGFVFVTQELDKRAEWVYAAESLGEFLLRYLEAEGNEYWHTGAEQPVQP